MLSILVVGICKGALWALVAAGFAMIFGTTRVFHFAHGAIFVWGAYFFDALLIFKTPAAVAFLGSILLAAILGVGIDAGIYRPLQSRGAPPTTVLLGSLAIYTVLVNTAGLAFGDRTLVLRAGTDQMYSLGPILITRMQTVECVSSLALFVVLSIVFRYTNMGLDIRAVADNQALAEWRGINTSFVRLVVVAFGSGLAAFAGIIAGLDTGLDPTAGLPISLLAVSATIFAGSDRLAAPMMISGVMGATHSLITWFTSGTWADALFYTILFGALIWRAHKPRESTGEVS